MSDRGARAIVQTAERAFDHAHQAAHRRSPISETDRVDGKPFDSRPFDTPTTAQNSCVIDAVDIARMEEYALLAVLLARTPDAALLRGLARIRGDSTPLGAAHAALAEAAQDAAPEHLDREFFDLFVGVGRGELLPYGSYYLTGFLNERPLSRLRDDLHALGIARADDQTEPEDHASILCEIMAGLAGGSLAAAPDAQQRLFEKHLAPWIGRFFADLEHQKNSDFYRRVGTVGRVFVEIETEAFALPS